MANAKKPAPKKPAAKKAAPKKAAAKKAAPKKPAPKKPASKKAPAKKPAGADTTPEQFDDIINLDDGWRGEMLRTLRAVIKAADPEAVEEIKWGNVPVWSHDGIITTGETYKAAVKLTFAHGAKLPDPQKLFNSSLGGGTRRAIDFKEGDRVNEEALKQLVRDAVVFNTTK